MATSSCAASKPNCTTRNQSVLANPDIAGIGVILSFLLTAGLAFLIACTVLFLDRYEKTIDFIRDPFAKNKKPYIHKLSPRYWRSPAFWSRVLSKNLLALSDTHLLTGIAIQFTALLQQCHISIYHFQVVTKLAFLTTVTHLLTLITLRNYFVKNRWINLPRVISMVGNLALLGYTSFITYSYDLTDNKLDISSSLACYFQDKRPPIKAAFGTKWSFLINGAIGGHVTIIFAMYFLSSTPSSEDRNKGILEKLKWMGALFRAWVIAPAYAIYGVYMASTALQKTQALGTPSVRIDGSEREWGFGQFLPVLLLALPLFAGWESFWEEKDEDRENRFGRTMRSSTFVMSRSSEHRGRFDPFIVERGVEGREPSSMDITTHTTPSPQSTPVSTSKLAVPSLAMIRQLDVRASPYSRPTMPPKS